MVTLRSLTAAGALLALAACQDAPPVAPPAAAPNVALAVAASNVDAALAAQLAAALPTDELEVIVNYDPALPGGGDVVGAAYALGARVLQFKHLSMLGAKATPAVINQLAALPGVTGVFANGRDEVLLAESVPSIKADRVWAMGFTGKGVGVAIMDSGVNGLHPDLAYPAKTVQNVKFAGDVYDLYTADPGTPHVGANAFVENVANTDNSSGHGTHVAGIVGATGAGSRGKYKGVAPDANIIGLSVGEGLSIINIQVLAGVDWIIENKAKYNIQVVNNSWGGAGAFNPNDPVNESMRVLHDAGVTVVFAAGNDGPNQNTMNRRSVAPWVISVAAACKLNVFDVTNSQSQCADPTGANRSRVLAGFSSRGIPGDPLQHPDISAPGVRIVSSRSYTGTAINALDAPSDARLCGIAVEFVDDYTCASGTSMASPHVAGVIALLEQATNGAITPDGALAVLQSTASPLTGYAEWEVGAGYVDALAAVKKVLGKK